MKIFKSFMIYQSPAILWALLLFIFSSIPHPPNVKILASYDDLFKHAIVYGIFGFFIARALFYQSRFRRLRENYVIFALLLGALYGISDEFHQYFVPGRSSEILDVLADCFGIMIGIILFYFQRRRVQKMSPP